MLRRLRTSEKGFTLMEIIIVIVILGILALLAIPRLLGFTDQAKIANDKEYAAIVARAAELYWASHDEAIAADDTADGNGLDGDMQTIVSAGLVDDPTAAETIQYNGGTFTGITIAVDAAGVATVTITYSGTESIVFNSGTGYTLTGL